MDVRQTLYQLSMERFEVFKSQDYEHEDFDVAFDINGKKLYANKFILYPVSSTFKSMLSDRWTKAEEAIKIDGNSFDDFKEFLTFLYSGECELTNDNILVMVDIAECYAVKLFKAYCEMYMIKMLSFENVYQMIELFEKYSLAELKHRVNLFISRNLSNFVKSEKSLRLSQSVITDIVKSCQKIFYQEDLFEYVYKWAENRAMKLQSEENNLDLNEAIKNELSEFLPLINFKIMNHAFFITFVVRKQFLFTDDQLKNMVFRTHDEVQVKVIDIYGKIMKGYLQCFDAEKVVGVIKSLKNIPSKTSKFFTCIWNLNTKEQKQPKPSTPSKLIKKDGIEWYLVYSNHGEIALKRSYCVNANDYFLAEMFPENGFLFNNICKIEVV